MIPTQEHLEAAFLLLCVAGILGAAGIGSVVLSLSIWHWWREQRHMALLQDELDAADREGRERDERARALQQTMGRPRGVRVNQQQL